MEELTPPEREALLDALDDEHQAWAIYDRVIADFGSVRPFTNIRDAQARHIEALTARFVRFALELPDNPWPGRVPGFASLQRACEAGLAVEIANAALYDRLLAVTRRPEILAVLRNLRQASRRHMPAFRRFAERGGQPGGGHECGSRGPR